MGNIRGAWPSPELRAGGLRLYEGNAFTLRLELELTDQDGSPVRLTGEDTVEVKIYDMPTLLWSERYTGMTENAVSVDFGGELSGLLKIGTYRMVVDIYHGGTVTTVADTEMEVM